MEVTPSPREPLTGSCLCGAVRFRITGPFSGATYCHCTHCQKRTGAAASPQGRVSQADFELLAGADMLRSFTPPTSTRPKVFCSRCGSSLFSGDPLRSDPVVVRLGVLDGDPGIRPSARVHARSAAPWEPLPADDLRRFDGPAPR